MRACVFRGGRLAIVDVPEPRPEPGQVLVRTLACGICGTDLHFLKHSETITRLNDEIVPTLGPAAIGSPHVDLSRDVFMGHEFCAEVLEVGADTRGPRPGTRVVSVPVVLSSVGVHRLAYNNDYPCGYAEEMLLSSDLLVEVPNGLEPRLAALTEPLAVGVHAVAKSGYRPGDTAIVLGCGPVGLAVIASLVIAGAETVVATDFSPARRSLAMAMGATSVVDPNSEHVIDVWRREADDSPPVIFEAVGVPGMIQEILAMVPIGTRVVVVGMCMESDTITPFYGIAKELSIQFVVAYTLEEFAGSLKSIAEGQVDVTPLITGSVDLEGMPSAFEALAHPDHHCKIVVEPSGTGRR